VGRQLRAAVQTSFVKQRLIALFARPSGADLAYLRGLLEDGTLRPAIDRTFRLPEVPEAIRYLQHGQTRGGKVVIIV
jgi:NADPH:quinone reductase-like Zn-dependent oxidoreductase